MGEIIGHVSLLKKARHGTGRDDGIGGRSRRLRQSEQVGRGFAPEGTDQPGLQHSGAVAQGAGIGRGQCFEGHAAQTAGLGHDPAGFCIRGDRLLPEDDARADFARKGQALIAVLNEHDARDEMRETVRPGAYVAARQAQGRGTHGFLRRRALPEGDHAVETVRRVTGVIAGHTEARDAQRQLCAR